MADALPSPNESSSVVTSGHLNRLRRLTFASLALNALILVLLVIGAIIHHHLQQREFAGRDGYGGRCFQGCYQGGWGRHFHHSGGMGMNRGWGRPDGFRSGSDGGDGFRDRDGGPGALGGGPDMPSRPDMSPPMPGMTGGPPSKPDPAKMTDDILNHLSIQLSLTEDEKAKIKPIVEQHVVEIQKEMEAQRVALQKQIEDAKAKIKPLLTADQQKQLNALPLPGEKPPGPDETKQPGP